MERHTWTIGEGVVVKPGVTDTISGCALGGWQGRLVALDEGRDRLIIAWDRQTLLSISPAILVELEAWGISWRGRRLSAQDVLPAPVRNREEDVAAILEELETQYSWLSLGEQGKRIREILRQAEGQDLFAPSRAWHAYLQEHLEVPFTALVNQDLHGPVPQGSHVTVTGISLLDETYGTIVRIRLKRRVYHFPLCHVQATAASAQVEQLIVDYATWFVRHTSLSARLSP